MSWALASDEVHSWCVKLDVSGDVSARLYATLTEDERSRSARFRFDRDRTRFMVARAALRELLGGYLGTTPGRVRFTYNAFGKPELGPEFGGRLRFNLSHSADLALIAIVADADVGVDVEYIREHFDYADVARHWFSTDRDRLSPHGFFRYWTKNEACVKARGASLAMPVVQGALSIYSLLPAPRYIGALAIERSGWRLRQCHWRC